MRVLILTQNYIPEPDPKMHILSKGLIQCGHQVAVITGFPNYPHGRIYPGYRQKPWDQEVLDGVRVVRLPLYPDRSRSPVRRAANFLSFATSASLLGPVLSGPADIMLVYHPPSTLGIPAWIISLVRHVPFAYEIQDMWPETLRATGMANNSLVLGALRKLGAFTYRRAAVIIVISPGFKTNLVEKGVPPEKIHVIPNWAYEDPYDLVEPDARLAWEWGLEGRFNIVYAGNMGPAQGLHNILDTASLITDMPEVQFVLVGDGVDRASLEEAARKRQLTNVRFLPRQPMTRMPALYALTDAILVHLTNDSLFAITIPGKTQSALASGRPIIASVAGDAADLVLEAGAGIVARPSDPVDFVRAIREVRALPREKREAMGAAGRRYYLNNLAPDVLIRRYEELFRAVLAASAASTGKKSFEVQDTCR